MGEHDGMHTAEVSREILNTYKGLQDQLANNGDDIGVISKIVTESNASVEKLDRPVEIREDASTVFSATVRGLRMIQSSDLGLSQKVDFDNVLNILQKKFSVGNVESVIEDWGVYARSRSTRVPTISSMIAPIEVGKKVIVRTKRTAATVDKSKQKRPGQVRAEDMQQGANQQSEIIKGINNYLKHYEKQLEEDDYGVPLYEFVINPTEFSQTVENLFYTSFLVRDGHIALKVVDGEPFIRSASDIPAATANGTERKTNQIAIDIDMETAEKLSEAYGRDTPMLPTRKYDEQHNITNLSDYIF